MQNQFKKLAISSLIAASAISAQVQAAEYSVTITNLTRGMYFTPLLVTAHVDSTRLFASGTAASTGIQAMAEGGDIAQLVTDLQGIDASIVENPASGLLGPGASTTATVNTDAEPNNTQLSVVSMLLPTNDAFIGLNGVDLPTTIGESTVFNVNAYDAGTEANDEIRGSGAPGVAGFPVPPGSPVDTGSGTGGTGINASVEGQVHIHRNVLGDLDATGGASDIDSTVHRWLNPVARVRVELVSQ